MIGGAGAAGVEFYPGADARPAANLAVQVDGDLIAVEDFDAERIGGVIRDAQAGEHLAAFRHRADGDGLHAVKICQAGGVRLVRPARP